MIDHMPPATIARITGGFYLAHIVATVLGSVLGSIGMADAPQVFQTIATSEGSFRLALRRLNREHGQTFVLVTHDTEVGAACDRIIRMRDGVVQAVELVTEPTPCEVLDPAA